MIGGIPMAADIDLIRVAVVQASPVVFDRERTLDKFRALTADAARDGAQFSSTCTDFSRFHRPTLLPCDAPP